MKILFCSDASSQSETAVRFGAQIAAACRAETSILGITSEISERDGFASDLEREQDILKEHQLEAEVVATVGNPVREVIKRTTQTQYDLVVIGATCKRPFLRLFDPWWMPARVHQAHRIIESINPPVLAVFCSRPALRRILLCTTGAAHSDEAGRIRRQPRRVCQSGRGPVSCCTGPACNICGHDSA